MQEQINNLQQQIDELKQALTEKDMPMELREIMRNEVVKDELDYTQTTNTQSVGPDGGNVTVPNLFTKLLIIKWRGKEYKIPFYN